MLRFFMLAALFSVALTGSAQAQLFATGLTTSGTLVTFSPATPGTIISTVSVTGLNAGETLSAIDFRPIDNRLIGLGYNSATGAASIYSIDSLGAATIINGNAINLGAGLTKVNADFNPTPNALRVVTSNTTTNNRRIPGGGSGVPVTDSDLNPGTPFIRANAYSRNNPGGGTSGATTLYAIDSVSGNLVTQGSIDFFTGSGTSPNTGTLTTVAALTGVGAANVVGFDIFTAFGAAASNVGDAYLATSSNFYSLDLTTGAATDLGAIGSGTLGISDVALASVPEPGTLMLAGCGGVALLTAGWRHRARKLRKRLAKA